LTTQRYFTSAVRMQAILGVIVLGLAGCGDALNPSFVNLVAPDSAQATVSNPPGYVVVALEDNVRIDGQLLTYLDGKLNLTPAQESALRARIRMRIRITFTDGTFQTVEFISGTEDFVEPTADTEALPDLSKNTLTNVAVRCDVASVQLEPGTSIDVFIPVTMEIWELVEVTVANEADIVPQLIGNIPPQFRALQVDDVDQDGNVTLLRNIDPRNVLSPIANLVCGSVVPIEVTGVLAVPFFPEGGTGNPGYDQGDVNVVAVIGGRYRFTVSAQ